jgi:hypothetical protein
MPLEGILETIQKDRATGTLHMNGSNGKATLYFLFGHLFHAVDAERQGEPVVYDVLDWHDGDFTFDSKAKLPAEETIKISTAELVARRTQGSAAEAPGPDSEAEAASEVAANEMLAEADRNGMAAPAGDEPETAGDVSEHTTEAEALQAPAPEVTTEVEAAPAPEPVATQTEPAAPTPDGSSFPRRRRTDIRPGTRPPETMELYPVPMGELIYQSLTAAFVDFPKLLRSLFKDHHSGYVRLSGDDFNAVLLFSAGAVVEAIYDGRGEVLTGVNAFQRFGKVIDNSEGNLDVIALSPEMVTATYQLLTAPSLYDKLNARFVRVDQLLEHLSEEGISGAAVVRLEGQCGIVFYRKGDILGCYTDSSPAVEADPAKMLALCQDPKAQIEVRGGPLPDALPVLEAAASGSTTAPAASSPPATAPPMEAPVAEAEPAPQAGAATEPEAASIPPETVAASGSEVAVSSNGAGAEEQDWPTLISAMAGRADAVLGTRAKKVKELLYSAGHNRQDVESTIDRISELSIMFVDPYKLTALAADMRQIAAGAG